MKRKPKKNLKNVKSQSKVWCNSCCEWLRIGGRIHTCFDFIAILADYYINTHGYNATEASKEIIFQIIKKYRNPDNNTYKDFL